MAIFVAPIPLDLGENWAFCSRSQMFLGKQSDHCTVAVLFPSIWHPESSFLGKGECFHGTYGEQDYRTSQHDGGTNCKNQKE